MNKFKIRCSSIGKIMGAKGLGDTGEKYLKEWMLEQTFFRKKEFNSKYTQKGNEVEDHSLDFVAEHLNCGMLLKNKKHFENDYMTGTPDAILSDLVIDVKNSWDFSTFPLFDTDIPKKDYYWQAQGYMELTGIKNFKLIYTLMDTPDHLIEREAYFYARNNGYEELDQSIYDMFYKRMTYQDVDKILKIKIFDIKYNEQDVIKIKDRVIECRKFIETLISKNNVK